MHRFHKVWGILLLARISLGLVGLGFCILWLDQGLDVVRGLIDDANVYLASGDLTGDSALRTWAQWTSFLLACIWSGLNAWYWPRLLFKLRGGPQPRWFTLLTRALGVAPLTAAIIAIRRADTDQQASHSWIGLSIFLLAAIAMTTALILRRKIFLAPGRSGRWYNRQSILLNSLRARLGGQRLDSHTLGDDAFFAVTLGLGALLLVLFWFPHSRVWTGWIIGSAGLAFGSVGIMIAVVSALAWAANRLMVNVLLTGLVLFVAFSWTNDNHTVRTLADVALEPRPSVDVALAKWDARAGPGPIILVAAAGGASRAGYWTETVLRSLDDRTGGQFAGRVFAISSVSGGSLGALDYAGWVADRNAQPGCRYDPNARLAFDQAFVGGDYLAPAVGSLLYPDLVQRFLPVAFLPDRAAALEEGWEEGWRWSVRHSSRNNCAQPAGSDRMAANFQDIWRPGLSSGGSWVPLVLVNGTSVETGKRIITAPVRASAAIFEDSYDFFDLVKRPVRTSTALLNGARFPIVSPAGTLYGPDGPRGRIVDGGYFENGGIETMYDLARYIRSTPVGQKREMILIEIDNDVPDSDTDIRADLARYGNTAGAASTALTELPVAPQPAKGAPGLSEITSIIGGLYNTRSGRGVLVAKRLSGLNGIGLRQPNLPAISRVTFNLARLSAQGTTMSWSLSLTSRDIMDLALDPSWTSGGTQQSSVAAARMGQWRFAEAIRRMKPNSLIVACQRMAADRIASKVDGRARPALIRCPVASDAAKYIGLDMQGF
jgi:hypothetical protein